MSHSLAPYFGVKAKVLTMVDNLLFPTSVLQAPWLPLHHKHAEQAPESLPFCVRHHLNYLRER